MAVNLSPVGGVAGQFFTNNGTPLSGGKIFTYAAGTTTNQATYTSASGAIAHTNPIILDSAGRVPSGEIWLTDGLAYKFVIKDSTDVLIGTYDNVIGINSNFVNFTNQQEIQTATAGQTVFNLTTMQYAPATNSLSVFVDGVNQYGPGAMYAYVETDSTTVTFTTGLHVGAEVKFTTSNLNSSAGGDAFNVSYTPPFTNSVTTNVGDKLAQTVSVIDFGADPTGTLDSTTEIQAAIDYAVTACSDIFFPSGTYRITDTLILQDTVSLVLRGESPTADRFIALAHASQLLWDGVDSANNYMIRLASTDPQFTQSISNSIVGLYLNCNSKASGIFLERAPHTQIINCSIQNCYNGIVAGIGSGTEAKCFTSLIENVFFENINGIGIDLQDNAHGSKIVRCDFSGTTYTNTTYSIRIGQLGQCSNVSVHQCTFQQLGLADATERFAVLVKNACKNFTLSESYIEGLASWTSLSINDPLGVSITGNRFTSDSTAAYAIKIFAGTNGVSIAGNYFDGFTNADVLYFDATNIGDVAITGNYGLPAKYRNYFMANGGNVATFNRRGTEGSPGPLVEFQHDDVTFATIDSNSAETIFLNNANGVGVQILQGAASAGTSQASFRPTSDNAQRLGSLSFRWSEVFAGTGSINTSDETSKEQIEAIPQEWLDAWGDVEFYRYKFKDAVATKNDKARWHIGVIAQRVKAAFEAKGIDAFAIGLLCFDEEDGKQIYGIRYDEALVLECAYLRSKLQ